MPIDYRIENERIFIDNLYANNLEGLLPSMCINAESPEAALRIEAELESVLNEMQYVMVKPRVTTHKSKVPHLVTHDENAKLSVMRVDDSVLDFLIPYIKSRYINSNSVFSVSVYDTLRHINLPDMANLYVDYSVNNLKTAIVNELLVKLEQLKAGIISYVDVSWNSALSSCLKSFIGSPYDAYYAQRSKRKDNEKSMYKYFAAKKSMQKPESSNILDFHFEFAAKSHLEYGVTDIRLVKYTAPAIVAPAALIEKRIVSLFKLQPNLKRAMHNMFSAVYERYSQFISVNVNDWDSHGTAIAFDNFNQVKNIFMLWGYDETKVTTMLTRLLTKRATKRGYELSNEIGVCSITHQVLPKFFLVDVTMLDGTKSPVSVKHIQSQMYEVSSQRMLGSDSRAKSPWKYKSSEHGWCQVKLSPNEVYYSDVLRHDARTQNFLSPRWLPNENVKTMGSNNKYTPQPWLGIELEVERRGTTPHTSKHADPSAAACLEDITTHTYDALGRDYVMFKRDGSLRGYNPFEIVTVPATLNYHKERWLPFLNNMELKSNLQSFGSGNCGMHVHISRDSFTGMHLAKFMRFLNAAENSTFVHKVAQRSNNSYCKYTEFKRLTAAAKSAYNSSKYTAVNTANNNTIEVRIFRGNLSKHAFYKNLEFVHALWRYTLDCSMQDLKVSRFLFWLLDPKNKHDKLYSHLQSWVIANNLNVSNVIIPKDTAPDVRAKLLEKRAEAKKIQAVVSRKYNTNTHVDTIGKGNYVVKKELIVSNQ